MRHHVLGMLEDGAGVQERLKIEDVVVSAVVCRMVPLHSMTSGTAARRLPGRRRSFPQAALASSLRGLAGVAPLMAICRGFMASGISRSSSILSRPLSKVASLTWT